MGFLSCIPTKTFLEIVWEKQGAGAAWAMPGHDCLCSCVCGHGSGRPEANPSVFTEAFNLWSSVACVLTGVNFEQHFWERITYPMALRQRSFVRASV